MTFRPRSDELHPIKLDPTAPPFCPQQKISDKISGKVQSQNVWPGNFCQVPDLWSPPIDFTFAARLRSGDTPFISGPIYRCDPLLWWGDGSKDRKSSDGVAEEKEREFHKLLHTQNRKKIWHAVVTELSLVRALYPKSWPAIHKIFPNEYCHSRFLAFVVYILCNKSFGCSPSLPLSLSPSLPLSLSPSLPLSLSPSLPLSPSLHLCIGSDIDTDFASRDLAQFLFDTQSYTETRDYNRATMTSNNWPPLRVFAQSWPHLTGCTHSELVDEWGQRLYAPHVWESGLKVIESKPTYDCPACAEPGRSHVNITTRPHGGVPPVSAPGSAALVTRGPTDGRRSSLNPTAEPFVPHATVATPQPSLSQMSAHQLLTHLRSDPTTQHPHKDPHRRGVPCPDNDVRCHFHHTTAACHLHWQECYHARRAVQASFNARSEWRGAPRGWNEEHAACIRLEHPVRCGWHEEVWRVAQPMVLRSPRTRRGVSYG
ncbi:hypothetical protein BDV97DRAFT_373218 [Delphinella strobiligena]|nr:hypothetical protein BDV97DRAFT_373218 [Delphinella strobiligena]